MAPVADLTATRIDRWLWAARFAKTRSLAAELINGGRVHLNGVRAKPSKDVHVGDTVEVTVGEQAFTVVVRGIAERRGSATVAQQLYEETDESRALRERRADLRRMAPAPGAGMGARPTKRDRRRIQALRDRREDHPHGG
ncbi:MAG: RNA-binding S4 domain-containing protein [Thermoleophilia bacterium]